MKIYDEQVDPCEFAEWIVNNRWEWKSDAKHWGGYIGDYSKYVFKKTSELMEDFLEYKEQTIRES